MKYFALFFLLNLSYLTYAQNRIEIKGSVLDESKKPLEVSTVFVSVAKDSTLIDYTITNLKGEFSLKIKKQTIPFFLKISTLGYADYTKHFSELEEPLDLGEIIVKSNSTELNELVIHADIPPIRVKKDTLEFNVASFKIRDGANVEYLLKQLPGIEIDSDKNVTINGKTVSQILVNGKPFFNEDGKIALQNLPSEIIEKVQVSKKKTKKEKLTKKESTSDEMSINLKVDTEKNKGVFGKIMAGYGSNKRYEANLIANYFNNKRQISVLSSSNNVNATGFSIDKTFDNMNNSANGNSAGITKASNLGFNYSDEFSEKVSADGSYFYDLSDFENKQRSTQINLLPTGNFTTFSNSNSEQDSRSQIANISVEYKIDSTSTLLISPNLTKSHTQNIYTANQYSLDEQENRLNQSDSKINSIMSSGSFNNEITYTKNLGKPSQFFTASFGNTNTSNDDTSYNESQSIFFQDLQQDDIRKQYSDSKNVSDKFIFEMDYSHPITDYLSWDIRLNYDFDKKINSNNVFDYDLENKNYSLLNLDNTSYYSSLIKTIKPITGFVFTTPQASFYIHSGISVAQYDINSKYKNVDYEYSRKYILPSTTAFFMYFSDKYSLTGQYRYNLDLQDARTLLSFEDLSNPLNIVKGNPDLDPDESHQVFFSISRDNFEKRFNYSVNLGSKIYANKVVNSTVYDENKKRNSTYKNISGIYNYFLSGNWSKSHKMKDYSFKYGTNAYYNYNKNKGFIDGFIYEALSNVLSTKAYFNFDYGELLTLSPSYNFAVNSTKYNNYELNSAINYSQSLGVQAAVYWRDNWVLGNDFGYTYNSNIDYDYQKDFYLWNISLSHTFWDKRFIAKVKVYDVLNQNTSSIRTVNSTSIINQENTVLKRYIMFSMAYNMERFELK